MRVLIVLAHPEPQSYNGALFDTAIATLEAAGHSVSTSDLYRMGFDSVSSRKNFSSVKDPDYLKLQVEELHASEGGGFAPDLEAELAKLEAADLVIWQFPPLVVRPPGHPQGLGGSGLCHGPCLRWGSRL